MTDSALGHRIQIDIKSFTLPKEGKTLKRYQYTAIDETTRASVLKIYDKQTPAQAIDFLNYVIDRFPLIVHTVQTENSHEFQARFRAHCQALGLKHVYIKPQSPHLKGKVERSQEADKIKFYQLISYLDDIDSLSLSMPSNLMKV